MKDGLKRYREAHSKRIWDQSRQFKNALRSQLDDFRYHQRRMEVSRKREIEKLFAARCRVVTEKTGPSEAEIIRSLVGNVSMLSGNLRELSKGVLRRKGMIKHPSIHEKYQKVFDKYTLTPDELLKLEEEMLERSRKHKQNARIHLGERIVNALSHLHQMYEEDDEYIPETFTIHYDGAANDKESK